VTTQCSHSFLPFSHVSLIPYPSPFFYRRIQSFWPSWGPSSGGTQVLITLDPVPPINPVSDIVCVIGDTRAAGELNAETGQVICYAPPSKPGSAMHLRVSLNGGLDLSPPVMFSSYANPVVSGVEPPSIVSGLGADVVILGSGFVESDDLSCWAGSLPASVLWVTPTALSCHVPPHSPGYVSLWVSVNGVDAAEGSAVLECSPKLTVYSLHPHIVPSSGGSEVVVTGEGFADVPRMRVRLGGESGFTTPAVFLSRTTLAFISPPITEGFKLLVEVTLDGSNFAQITGNSSGALVGVSDPEVLAATPSQTSTKGGQVIFVHGANFIHGYTHCRFSSSDNEVVSVLADVTSVETALCSAPAFSPGRAQLEIVLTGQHEATASVAFSFLHPIVVISHEPLTGPEFGGTEVIIHGEFLGGYDFIPEYYCRFGLHHAVPALRLNHTALSCVSPAAQTLGSVELSASFNGYDWASSPMSYTYVAVKTLTTVFPRAGPLSGGTRIQLGGTGFLDDSSRIYCSFGGLEVAATVLSMMQAECIAPARGVLGAVELSLVARVPHTKQRIDFTSRSSVEYVYQPRPVVDSVFPKFGPTRGGTLLTLTGQFEAASFDNALVRFQGQSEADGVFSQVMNPILLTDTSLTVKAPSTLLPAPVSVEVSLNGGVDYSSSGILFFYESSPDVLSASPRYLSERGGTRLTVLGRGFPQTFPSATVCLFGGGAPVVGTFISSTSLECTSPALPPGRVDILVSFNGGADWESVPMGAEVRAAATVAHVFPLSGPARGGTRITLEGSGFKSDYPFLCTFGPGLRTTAHFVDEFEIACDTPPGLPSVVVPFGLDSHGAVEVIFSLRDMPLFEYYDTESIAEIHPNHGVSSGGTWVEVRGGPFASLPSLACKFGELLASAKWDGENIVRCLAPPAEVGSLLNVMVAANGVDFWPSGASFHYTALPNIEYISPTMGSILGGTVVNVRSKGAFLDLNSTVCRFGFTDTVPAHFIDSSTIWCASPPASAPGPADITVSLNGQDFTGTSSVFLYADTVAISSIHPTLGPEEGGTRVSIVGANLPKDCICRFNEVDSIALWISNEVVECILPPRSGSDVVSVAVLYAGGTAAATGDLVFTYHGAVALDLVAPSSVPASGGSIVRVLGAGFLDVPDLRCRFGDEGHSLATYVSPGEILCESPPSVSPGSTYLAISLNGGDFTRRTLEFSYYVEPVVVEISPRRGLAEGGDLISIQGTNLLGGLDPSCRFLSGEIVVADVPAWDSPNGIMCQTPPLSPSLEVQLISVQPIPEANEIQRIVFSAQPEGPEIQEVEIRGQGKQLHVQEVLAQARLELSEMEVQVRLSRLYRTSLYLL
jgi:hypothetical protein